MEQNNGTTQTREALLKDVGNLKEDAAKIVHDVKAHASAHVDQTRQRVTNAVSAAQAQVASHPLAVLATGLVVGYLLGARRRRRRS